VTDCIRTLPERRQGRSGGQSRHYTALWYADSSVIKVGMDLQERKSVTKLRPPAIPGMRAVTLNATYDATAIRLEHDTDVPFVSNRSRTLTSTRERYVHDYDST
jgi:hypothetical protein